MITDEEVRASVEALRERRRHLGEIRDYKPQSKGSKSRSEAKEPTRPPEEVFADLLAFGASEESSEAPASEAAGEGKEVTTDGIS